VCVCAWGKTARADARPERRKGDYPSVPLSIICYMSSPSDEGKPYLDRGCGRAPAYKMQWPYGSSAWVVDPSPGAHVFLPTSYGRMGGLCHHW